MGFFDFFKRRKEPTDSERRAHLRRYGRITEGVIIDAELRAGDEIVYYMYTLNGVDFESSERLDDGQRQDRLKYAPGQKINVRFNPKNQGDSTLE
ncbi:MAG TPA: hypothetical protein VEV84_06440 [Pyrinomonadaceae bacterium]|nr:hypothetical protein [Pyrinomonadaceae bacterium]